MKLLPLGGAKEVGRSAYFLKTQNGNVLFDFGIKITKEEPEFPLDVPKELDAVVISHAHLDHSGWIPRLFREQYVRVFATSPTKELSKLLWQDAIKVADIRGHSIEYTPKDYYEAYRFSFALDYREKITLKKGLSIELFDAGHILGSAITRLETKEGSFVYTGDYKVEKTLLQSGAKINEVAENETDFLMTESTYGHKDHPPREKVEKEFISDVKEVLENGGFVILPTFALGRTHELILLLHKNNIEYPIYFDGLGQKVARVYKEHPTFYSNRREYEKALNNVIWIKGIKSRKRALKKPGVIVTTAGMLQGGPVLFYLEKLRNNEKSAIFFTGYQIEDTPGRILLETGKLVIDEAMYETKLKVKQYDLSAHVSRKNIIKSVEKINPKKGVILVHGEEGIEPLRTTLEDKGFKVLVPENGKEYVL